MAKAPKSALRDMFISIRRVIVLLVAAFALAMGWPLPVLLTRVAILWATLVILSHGAEILLQYLTHRALERQSEMLVHQDGRAASS